MSGTQCLSGSPTGYLHPAYAASLDGFGSPRHLPNCDGWVLERPIPGTTARDAMGCYPLFACRDWSRLPADIEDLTPHLVSLVIVSDPFGNWTEEVLRASFDRVIPFKDHLVADLSLPLTDFVSRDRHRCARMASRRGVQVEECARPPDHLDAWMELFGDLATKRGIRGVRAFSREAFASQFSIPGFVMLRAMHFEKTVGMGLFMVHGDVAYAHVAAYEEASYHLRTSCAIYWRSLEILAGRVRWIDWGGSAGTEGNPASTLALFKQGWASGSRPTFLCCRIIDRDRYNTLTLESGGASTDYFPAYRAGER